MAAKITHKVLATTGTYKDRNTGEGKKRYTQVGVLFTGDDGRMSIKMECIPVGQEWSGWLSIYPMEERQGQAPRQQQRRPATQQEPARQEGEGYNAADAMADDDIPF